jgi:Fic family protein
MRRETKIATRQTASDYLKKLMEIGVLIEKQAGREKLFIHAALFDLLRDVA